VEAKACRGRSPRRRRKKSQTTQFVVGAAGETDKEFLAVSSHLYGKLGLARIYFSAFQPPGRVDFGSPRAPLTREHRLYQADFLLRKYGFRAEEIPLEAGRNLSLAEDPKTAWARRHPGFFPVEINTAPRSALLRVPGLGPISVRRIVQARREGRLSSRAHLAELGVRPLPALRYLLLDGACAVEERKQVQAGFEFGG
jgi:predicted DNA-binding helix-hairpin-helix protein